MASLFIFPFSSFLPSTSSLSQLLRKFSSCLAWYSLSKTPVAAHRAWQHRFQEIRAPTFACVQIQTELRKVFDNLELTDAKSLLCENESYGNPVDLGSGRRRCVGRWHHQRVGLETSGTLSNHQKTYSRFSTYKTTGKKLSNAAMTSQEHCCNQDVHSRPKRAHQKPSTTIKKMIKHDQKRGRSKTITPKSDRTRGTSKTILKRSTKCFSVPWPDRRAIASHRTASPRPTTRMSAGQCSSSVAASSVTGKTAH